MLTDEFHQSAPLLKTAEASECGCALPQGWFGSCETRFARAVAASFSRPGDGGRRIRGSCSHEDSFISPDRDFHGLLGRVGG